MAKGEFCEIKGMKPSPRTVELIEDMNDVQNMSKVLEGILTAVPFFQIFAGRDTYAAASFVSMGYNYSTYDFQMLSDAFKGISALKRKQLIHIAGTGAFNTHGEERKFWECVYNAL